MKPPRNPNGNISPLAIILLIAMLALPPLFFFGVLGEDRQSIAPPVYDALIEAAPGGKSGEPTQGMAVGPDGFGNVDEAPLRIVPSDGPQQKRTPGISPDIAAFLRGLVSIEKAGGPAPGPDGTVICTLEGPPVWRGKAVLRGGCLVLQVEGQPDRLIAAPGMAVYRDDEGYLALSTSPYRAQDTIRAGEPEGLFRGIGCSAPHTVPAPEALAKACRVTEAYNLLGAGRKPLCSPEEAVRLKRQRAAYEADAKRIRNTHEGCIADGGNARSCPPPVIPPPFEIFDPPCREGTGIQPSQRSSTQP